MIDTRFNGKKFVGFSTEADAREHASRMAMQEVLDYSRPRSWSVLRAPEYSTSPDLPFLAVPTPEVYFEVLGRTTGWVRGTEIGRADAFRYEDYLRGRMYPHH